MNIRLATLTDIPAIMKLIADVVPLMITSGNLQWNDKYPNPAVFEKDIELEQLWAAEIDGEIAGIAAITTDQYPEYAQAGLDINETAIVTHRLAVSPNFRGKGIAAELLIQAEHEAVKNGFWVLRSDTNAMNSATQKLFSKLGYTFKGEIILESRPGLQFCCYEKKLN